MDETVTITAAEMQAVFTAILKAQQFSSSKALQCAEIFTANSVDGVYSHGVNRFAKFVDYVKKGFVKPGAVPFLKHRFGGMEQWDGALGAGPLNAVQSTERAMKVAAEFGIGCVALANTNHWMRGGYYGWKAAKAGFVFIGWTNTIANMPAWNAKDSRLGNNPLVMALPYGEEAIVLDMAMSQFSFGAMEQAAMCNEKLQVAGGYDSNGELSNDPVAIIDSRRPLPVGYWKGAGLSLLMDLLATILSSGLSTSELSKHQGEYAISQVFIAIDLTKLSNHSLISGTIKNIISDYHQSVPATTSGKISFPGERVIKTRAENVAHGIPVLKTVWDEVIALKE